MGRARLVVDLAAVAANWKALDALSGPLTETGAVVKADAYGLGMVPVARALAAAGARTFFVAIAEEGTALRAVLGPGPVIHVLSGYMEGDREAVAGADLVPVLATPDQVRRFAAELPGRPAALQIDTGINRLGLSPLEVTRHYAALLAIRPRLVMSHFACAEEPANPMNALQLGTFATLALGFPAARRSIAATAGLLLGPFAHMDLVRPGIGLFGGQPFRAGRPVLRLALPVVQLRELLPGEGIGYGLDFRATRPTRAAILGAGYADGIPRALAGRGLLHAGASPCPVLGRISMDLMAADVTDLAEVPAELDLIGPEQGFDALAAAAGTIGHEILARLGSRLARHYKGAD